jgi:hypothetical protein
MAMTSPDCAAGVEVGAVAAARVPPHENGTVVARAPVHAAAELVRTVAAKYRHDEEIDM